MRPLARRNELAHQSSYSVAVPTHGYGEVASGGPSERSERSLPRSGQLFGDYLCEQWAVACHALAVPDDETAQTIRMLRSALPGWADQWIGERPGRSSYVADDGFPAEMSVNWSGQRPELRLLFDSVGNDLDPGPRGSPAGPVTRRSEQVHEIFQPRAGRPSAAPLWHALAWRPPSRVIHKSYLGLYEWSLPQRHAAVGEAMDRLGMAGAWEHARQHVERAAGRREVEFFAVDETSEPDARVKVYYRNHGADVDEMNRIASVASGHDSAAAPAAYRILTADDGAAGEAALSCLAFRPGLRRVVESTTYLRLADLAPNDQQAVDRTAALLRHEGIDPAPLRALAGALAPGPLAASRGLLALVSYRAAGRRGDVTTYFRFPVYDRPAPLPVMDPSNPADARPASSATEGIDDEPAGRGSDRRSQPA